jgi:hypothetical protein
MEFVPECPDSAGIMPVLMSKRTTFARLEVIPVSFEQDDLPYVTQNTVFVMLSELSFP